MPVLHRGHRVTFRGALPHLLKLRQDLGRVRTIWRCKCSAGPCLRRPTVDLPILAWSVCPYGLLRSPHLVTCIQLERLARIAPVDGWPGDLPPWLVEGVMVLREANGG